MSASNDRMEDDPNMGSWTEVCNNTRATDRARVLHYLFHESDFLFARLREALAVYRLRD
jgi:hypothetical protein